MQIRRARIDEADLLSELVMRSKQSNGYDDAFMESCREELAVTPQRLRQSEFWVVEDRAVCGCACLMADTASQSAEVASFFVDPGHKRKGVGQLLWEKLLQRANELELKMLHLDADPAAVRFYEKQGFRNVRQTPSGSIAGRTIPYMELHLVR